MNDDQFVAQLVALGLSDDSSRQLSISCRNRGLADTVRIRGLRYSVEELDKYIIGTLTDSTACFSIVSG